MRIDVQDWFFSIRTTETAESRQQQSKHGTTQASLRLQQAKWRPTY